VGQPDGSRDNSESVILLRAYRHTAWPALALQGRSRIGSDLYFVQAVDFGTGDYGARLGGGPWIFWMNFIVGLAVSAAVVRIFKGSGDQRKESFDIWGALTLLIGYSALLVGPGTIGTTTTVALMEINASGDLWSHAAAFAGAQQFAFTCLALVGLVGVAAGLRIKPPTTVHLPRIR
jgi:hypothetical protein